MSPLILVFFSFDSPLPTKPIMVPFFWFFFLLSVSYTIYRFWLSFISQLVFMQFSTEWSKILPVPNIQIIIWFLFLARNSLKLVFSQMSFFIYFSFTIFLMATSLQIFVSMNSQIFQVVGKPEPCRTFIHKFLSVYYSWQHYQQCIRWGQGFSCAYAIVSSISSLFN